MKQQYTELVISVGSIVAGFIGTALSVYFYTVNPKEIDRFEATYNHFESAVVKTMNNNASLDINSLNLYYEAATNKSLDSLDFKPAMRKALVKLHFNIASGKFPELSEESYAGWLQQIRKNIDEFEEIAPYEGLHPIERSLFLDISLLNDKPEVESKLRQLASVELARFEELESAKTEARWSLIFGIAGVVGAIISIIIAVWQIIRKPHTA
ncbi:hypothetical protein ACEWAC_23005 [Vibrio parahaemolyticus]